MSGGDVSDIKPCVGGAVVGGAGVGGAGAAGGAVPHAVPSDLKYDYVMVVDPNDVQSARPRVAGDAATPVKLEDVCVSARAVMTTISVPAGDDGPLADATSRYTSQAELTADDDDNSMTKMDTSFFWRHVTDASRDAADSHCARKVLKSSRRGDTSSTCTSSQHDTDDDDDDDGGGDGGGGGGHTPPHPHNSFNICSSPSQFVFVNGQPGFTGAISQDSEEQGDSCTSPHAK